MASFSIHVSIGSDARELRVSESMRVQELKEICCNLIGVQDVDKSYLWKGDVQLKQTSLLLRDYGVVANDLLEFKRKRSRGAGKTAECSIVSFTSSLRTGSKGLS